MYHFAMTYALVAATLATAPPTAAAAAAATASSRWPSVRFDDRRGVVVLQAPVFVPEILLKGASLGHAASVPSFESRRQPSFAELSGRRDAWTAGSIPVAIDLGAPTRIESIDRAQALTQNTKKCTLLCAYGMQTDVEGVELCKCRDPCREVLCQEGEKCVPEKSCNGDGGCRYRGTCQARPQCIVGKPRSGAAVSSGACSNATRRYYFDDRMQRCRKYRGCADLSGSYATLKQCSQACEEPMSHGQSTAGRPAPAATRTPTSAAPTRPPAATTVATSNGRGPAGTAGVGSVLVHVSKQRGGGGRRDDDDCSPDQPLHDCPYNPCDRCSIPGVVCRPSRCGHCRAVYYNVKTGFSAVREGGGFC